MQSEGTLADEQGTHLGLFMAAAQLPLPLGVLSTVLSLAILEPLFPRSPTHPPAQLPVLL
jgi:hypothetical protein